MTQVNELVFGLNIGLQFFFNVAIVGHISQSNKHYINITDKSATNKWSFEPDLR